MFDRDKEVAAEAGAALIEAGMVVGLGSGSTSELVVHALAKRVRAGLQIVGAIPTSNRTAALARELGILLTDLSVHPQIDLTIDGADEVDPRLNLIKGLGGALLREKIVASNSRRLVIVADESKLVKQLGARTPLPVEVVPFAAVPVERLLRDVGALTVITRQAGVETFVTDNGNIILDCAFGPIGDPAALEQRIGTIVGVVESGLFIGRADLALIGTQGSVRKISRLY